MALTTQQEEAVSFLESAGRGILADPPGSGKTAATLQWVERTGRNALVVAPADVIPHWLAEVERWTDLEPVYGMGSPVKRRERYENFQPGQVLVTNYELLRRDFEALDALKFTNLVADEAHRFKERPSQQTKAANKIIKRADTVALLTGTPILNGPEELWPLLHLVRPKVYRSFWRWAYEHFEVVKTDFNGKLPMAVAIVGDLLPGHAAEIGRELTDVFIQRPDNLDLPPAIEHFIPVELSADERRAYDQLRDYSWMQLGDEVVKSSNAIARTTRSRQLISEWTSLNEDVGIGSKVRTAQELLKLLGERDRQVIVGVQFRAAAERLASEGYAEAYTGALTRNQRQKMLGNFTSGETQVIAGTQATMGEGVDGLQVAHDVLMLDRDWTPSRNDQFIARSRRRGQTKQVFVYHFVACDTVDEDQLVVLDKKRSVINEVLDPKHRRKTSAVHSERAA